MKGSVFHALKRLIVLPLRCEKLVPFYRYDLLRGFFLIKLQRRKGKGENHHAEYRDFVEHDKRSFGTSNENEDFVHLKKPAD